MNILVIGGMHGNEPLGLEVVELLARKPLKGVDTLRANLPAIKQQARFIESDLNRSFPGQKAGNYEDKRAAEIVELAAPYEVVLDFHNTHCPDNDCGFVGQKSSKKIRDVSAFLGLPRVIVANYDCINKYVVNCLSIEISLDSTEMDAQRWYSKIKALSEQSDISLIQTQRVETYQFVYRMTLEDKVQFNLPAYRLQAFKALPEPLAKNLGQQSPCYPIFVNDTYTPYNYGGLIRKIDV